MKMRTVRKKELNSEEIPPEPKVERIPIRVDDRTIIMVKKGESIREHVERYKARKIDPPKSFFWQ